MLAVRSPNLPLRRWINNCQVFKIFWQLKLQISQHSNMNFLNFTMSPLEIGHRWIVGMILINWHSTLDTTTYAYETSRFKVDNIKVMGSPNHLLEGPYQESKWRVQEKINTCWLSKFPEKYYQALGSIHCPISINFWLWWLLHPKSHDKSLDIKSK